MIYRALLAQVIQIFLALTLYRVLKAASKPHATLMVIFILLAVPMAMLNDGIHFAVLQLVSGAEYLTTFTAEQRQTLALFPMGSAIFKSGYLPRVIGILLMIGCLGYLFDSFTALLLPDLGFTVAQFTFIGELLLPLKRTFAVAEQA